MSSETNESGSLAPINDIEPTGLLATIQRLYFYLVATISLLVGLSALLALVEVLSRVWLGDAGVSVNTSSYMREIVARSGGILLVATPIFLIHWRYIRRSHAQPAELTSAIRKFFLYLISAITLGWAASMTVELLAGISMLLLGVPLSASEVWPSRWLFLLFGILVNGALFAYVQHQLRTDGDWGKEMGRAATCRRLFQAIIGLVGLSIFIAGSGSLLEALLQAILHSAPQDVGEYWTRERLSMGFAMMAIGALVWRFNWLNWQQIIRDNPNDGKTALRRLYLYGSVIISALVALVPAAMLLRQLLLLLFGAGGASEPGGNGLATPLAFLPIGLVLWWWHWRVIQKEAASYGDTPESAMVRRIYYYAVAALGLILIWLGLVDILRVLLDILASNQAVFSRPFWAEQLANGLSLLAIGAPVWALHWRAVQSVARRPDADGEAERSSWPRRLYLYAMALAGALIILYYLAMAVYRFLLVLLGEPNVDLFGAETVDALARSAITVVFWLVAVRAIRQDGRLGAEYEAGLSTGEGISVEVVEVDTVARQTQLEARIQQLETELSAARSELAALQDSE